MIRHGGCIYPSRSCSVNWQLGSIIRQAANRWCSLRSYFRRAAARSLVQLSGEKSPNAQEPSWSGCWLTPSAPTPACELLYLQTQTSLHELLVKQKAQALIACRPRELERENGVFWTAAFQLRADSPGSWNARGCWRISPSACAPSSRGNTCPPRAPSARGAAQTKSLFPEKKNQQLSLRLNLFAGLH